MRDESYSGGLTARQATLVHYYVQEGGSWPEGLHPSILEGFVDRVAMLRRRQLHLLREALQLYQEAKAAGATERDLSEMRVVLAGIRKDISDEGPASTFIYFIYSESACRLKIGFSATPGKRWQALGLASPSPLRLLGTIPGTMAMEKSLHRRFAQYRTNGEWFVAASPLMEAIQQMLRDKL